MKTIGAYEAKTRFSKYLDQVEQGEELVITRKGRPVAILKPFPEERPDLVGELRDFRQRHSIAGRGITSEEIQEFRDEGRQ